MPVCNFFLQGRCRYGDKCWNEHPRGGGGGGGGRGGGGGNYNRSSAPQQNNRGGGGGFSNRVWVNPSQRSGGSYIQPSTFGGDGASDWGRGGGGASDWGRGGGASDWGRGGGASDWGGGGGASDWGRGGGGGGRRENVKSSDFSFSQNRFSALNSASSFDKGGRAGGAAADENEKMLDTVHKDIEIWEVSGQWKISCYGVTKSNISGFTDLSPEELRLEYYSARTSGDTQTYSNGVNQLFTQWKNRIQELKMMNPNTCSSLFSEPSALTSQPSSGGFGSGTTPGFGSSASSSSFGTGGFGAPAPAQASTFSFAPSGAGFGSTGAAAAPTGFGSAVTAPATTPTSGFGSSSSSAAPTASSFSFTAPASDKAPPTSGFGSSAGFGSASGFSLPSTAAGGGFGGGFGSGAAPAGGGTGFGSSAAGSAASGGGLAGDSIFTPQSDLTPEELSQFQARRFTLGQIPLRPPPADLLMVEII